MMPIRPLIIPSKEAFGTSASSISEPSDSAVFFTSVQQAYRQAEKASRTVIKRDFLIHGHRVRIRFAGSALVEPCTTALEHLTVEVGGAPPELTLCAWDSDSTGVLLPPCPWPPEQIAADGMVKGSENDSIRAALQIDIGALSLFDPNRHRAFFRVVNASALPAAERASPLKIILHWWLRGFDMTMIHCAAVGNTLGGALLVGHTGSGKSTSALACLSAGMLYVTDDRCLLSLAPEPRALCIYNAAKLWPDQMRRFPSLMEAAGDHSKGEKDKALLFVQRFSPAQLAMQLPIRVVLLARIASHPETTLTSTTAIRALHDLVPSTLMYQPGAARDELSAMAELVRRVPCRQINLGSELGRIPEVVAHAIESSPGAK
jgi:hypothetical protein